MKLIDMSIVHIELEILISTIYWLPTDTIQIRDLTALAGGT
jgi:hypothetical protein